LRRAVALLLVIALVLTGVGVVAFLVAGSVGRDYDPVPVAVPDDAGPATQPTDEALAAFYDQDLEWTPCGGDECATLTVPLDYDDPEGATIGLHLNRRPADDSDARLGSMVVNPGGPGAAGSDVAANAQGYFGSPLLEHFDVVGFDPRGTGRSDPVDCLSDADLDDYLAADPAPTTPQETSAFMREVRGLGRGCAQESGDLASHISTEETARDIDILRAALGEAVISYFGFSYGTELGATYAELFPSRVGRFVLDGGVDPSLSVRDATLTQARGFETALRAYVANCLEVTDSCFLGDSLDEGLSRIQDLLAQVDEEPLPTTSGRPLTLGLAVTGIITPLYSRDAWIVLSQALRSAFDGDGSTLMLLADQYSGRSSDGTYSSNLMEAFPAISCLDDPEGSRPADVPGEYAAFDEASPTFGRVFAWSMVTCHGWRPARGSGQPDITIDAEGAAPIVVVGTTRDPATPLEESEALADQLSSGVLVTRDGDGHTGYFSGNDCVDEAVESYLIEGVVPRDGLMC
jgi:pimeloyl-ACP methyl ester carboxylesterase